MSVDRAHREAQLPGNLPIAQPHTDEVGDLPFPIGEGRRVPGAAQRRRGRTRPAGQPQRPGRGFPSATAATGLGEYPGRVGGSVRRQHQRTERLEPIRRRDEQRGFVPAQTEAVRTDRLGHPSTASPHQLLDPPVT